MVGVSPPGCPHLLPGEPGLLPPAAKPLRIKEDILACTAAELNYGLAQFVKEVTRPNGERYEPDSIYYLCLGIQQVGVPSQPSPSLSSQWIGLFPGRAFLALLSRGLTMATKGSQAALWGGALERRLLPAPEILCPWKRGPARGMLGVASLTPWPFPLPVPVGEQPHGQHLHRPLLPDFCARAQQDAERLAAHGPAQQ